MIFLKWTNIFPFFLPFFQSLIIRNCFDFLEISFYEHFLSLFSVFFSLRIRHIARYAPHAQEEKSSKTALRKKLQ